MDRNKKLRICALNRSLLSLSARRAWIEIAGTTGKSKRAMVALRKESVDRNRNYGKQHNVSIVALRKESVDRNPMQKSLVFVTLKSLSARRAWIEIK